MSTISHYDQGDLALFAMQLLPRAEYTTMAMHITDCTYCRQELAQLQGDLATYAHTVEMHSPPALIRDRLINQVAREKKFAPAERTERPEPLRQPPPVRQPRVERPAAFERRETGDRTERVERIESVAAPTFGYPARGQKYATGLGSGRYLDEDEDRQDDGTTALSRLITNTLPWIGWMAAAGLAIIAGNLYHERDALRSHITAQSGSIDRLRADSAGARQLLDTITDPTARQITLTRTEAEPGASAPLARVIYVAQRGALLFFGSNLDPVPTYKTYQLWLIPSDGRDPIPAGTFHPDVRGNASVILPPLPKGIEAKAFGVTLEDDGGSQSPTMPIVLAGN